MPTKAEKSRLERDVVIETIQKTEVLFVLAHGHPPQKNLEHDAKFRVLGAAEARIINPGMKVVFVGGSVPDKSQATSRQMQEYFGTLSEPANTEVLDTSNNTVGNIEEIIEYLKNHPEVKRISIIAAKFQIDRISKILKNLGLDAEVVAYDPLVASKSEQHRRELRRHKRSVSYQSLRVVNKLMMLYMKVDPHYRLVKAYRSTHRRIKSKL